jgi:hypothetical protein
MKYQPDQYIARIHVRKDDYEHPVSWKDEPLLDTWEEAHEWMISDRMRKVQMAKDALARAQRNHQRVLAMKPKGRV